MKTDGYIFVLVLWLALVLTGGEVYAAWSSPSANQSRIVPNPVNGGVASVVSVWNSGSSEYDIEVKFIDDQNNQRTETIASTGKCYDTHNGPACAVDPISGDVAVAWWEAYCVGGSNPYSCPQSMPDGCDEGISASFKYKVFYADGSTPGPTVTLYHEDKNSSSTSDAIDWHCTNFDPGLPTLIPWSGSDTFQKFEGWVDIVHSGVSGDGWHIAVSYAYSADSKWVDFYSTFGQSQTNTDSVLFRFATLVFQNATDSAGGPAEELFSSTDLDPSAEYFDHPNVRKYEYWASVPPKVVPLTSVTTTSGDAASGVLYVPTYGAVYEDDLEWAEDGVTCGSLALDEFIQKVSVATSKDGSSERVHVAYGGNVQYKTPGSGSWSATNVISDVVGETITAIQAIPGELDMLYVLSYAFFEQVGDGPWYYDFYALSIWKISSIDGAVYAVGSGLPYWAYTPFVSYPGTRTLAINESTPGTPSEFYVIFHQADWESLNRYDEDWEAIPGQSVLVMDTSP